MGLVICSTCGVAQEITPDKPKLFGMRDNHTFREYHSSTIEHLVEQWRADLAAGDDVSLCPIRLYSGKRYLREVGRMLHCGYGDIDGRFQVTGPHSEEAVAEFIAAANSDPDLPRLLMERSNDEAH